MMWTEEWKDLGIFFYILVARLWSLLQVLLLIRDWASSNPQMKYIVSKRDNLYLAQCLPCSKPSFHKYKKSFYKVHQVFQMRNISFKSEKIITLKDRWYPAFPRRLMISSFMPLVTNNSIDGNFEEEIFWIQTYSCLNYGGKTALHLSWQIEYLKVTGQPRTNQVTTTSEVFYFVKCENGSYIQLMILMRTQWVHVYATAL